MDLNMIGSRPLTACATKTLSNKIKYTSKHCQNESLTDRRNLYQTGCQKFDRSFDTKRVDVEIEVAGQMRVDEKRRESRTDYFVIPPWHIRVDGDMRVDGIFE